MKTKIKWGIVGLGNIANQFAQDLQLVAEAQLVAVASRDAAKATEFSQKFGAQFAHNSYEALFANPEVDIVYIATPHSSHASLSIQALNNKKHVLCEKPIALNLAETKQMVAASQKNNRFLMEAFWTRFIPAFRAAENAIIEGKIGTVYNINADFSFCFKDPNGRLLNPSLGGGSLLDIGVYPLFISYVLLGIPSDIVARAILHPSGIDLQTAIILQYPNAQATLHSSIIKTSEMKAVIAGSLGRIELQPWWHNANGFSLITDDETTNYDLPTLGKGFTHEILECHSCIDQNSIESTLWSHQNSIDLMTIVDEIARQIGVS